MLEEVRQESPGATPEELAALAADRVEEDIEAAEAEAAVNALQAEATEGLGEVSTELRAAAGDLRAAADEQRSVAGQIGESAADLRSATDRLLGDSPDLDAERDGRA